MEEIFSHPEMDPDGRDEAIAADEDVVRQVRELLLALLKTKRAYEMYPSNNPILIKFQEDLFGRFSRYFQTEDRMDLVITKGEIFFQGLPVYHSEEKDDNLARVFYRDGLREISFKKGFTSEEVMDFVDVVRTRPETSVESYDDDIATLMWEKDFVHLSYYVVEEFEEGAALEDEEVARLLAKGSASEGDLREAYKDAVAEEPKKLLGPLESISLGATGVFSLGEEEVNSLRKEMDSLTDKIFLQSAIDALFETLYLGRQTPDFISVMDSLDSALAYLANTGQFSMAGLVLKRIREFGNKKEVFGPSNLSRIQASLSQVGSEGSIKRLAVVLNSRNDINPDELRLYLYQLDKNSIMPLFELMAEVQDAGCRKAAAEALVNLGRANLDLLVRALRDRRWQVVRNAAAILGRIGDTAIVDDLKSALSHQDPRVRREVVRSLGMIGGPRAGEVLLLATDDPDQQIRMAALRFMPRVQSHTVLDSLMEVVTRKDFIEKPLSEKRVFFEVMAEMGQERVLKFLVRTLRKKGFFESAKKEEYRAASAYGLGNIRKGDEALESLTKEMARAKKGSPLHEAINYSIAKLAKPASRTEEA